jgi:hypothetical protein
MQHFYTNLHSRSQVKKLRLRLQQNVAALPAPALAPKQCLYGGLKNMAVEKLSA